MVKDKLRQAFTLIELAIVLVIIGLISGGVLVGQDLIRSAEISATVKQVQNFNSAVATFRTKYNAIPGDMGEPIARSFGFNVEGITAGSAGTGERDGNFIITDNQGNGGPGAYGETLLFWNDLRAAELISDISTPTAPNNNFTSLEITSVTDLQQYLPAAKVGKNNHFIAFGRPSDGLNYYQIARITGFNTNSQSYNPFLRGLTTNQAFNIDSKLDDGRPNTGIVTAFIGESTPDTDPTTNDASLCASGTGTSATYDEDDTVDFDCSLVIRMQ